MARNMNQPSHTTIRSTTTIQTKGRMDDKKTAGLQRMMLLDWILIKAASR